LILAIIQKAKCVTTCNETDSKTDVKYSKCVNSCANPEITNNLTIYPIEEKTRLIESCVNGGGTEQSCVCAIQYIETKISWEELSLNQTSADRDFANKFNLAMLEGLKFCE